jgi:hypothetical protein
LSIKFGIINSLKVFSLMKRLQIHNLILIFSAFWLSIVPSNAQILKDTAALELVKRGVDSLYSLQFSYAREVYRTISTQYPDNPVVVAFKVIMIYSENYPLLSGSPVRDTFEEEAQKCIELSEKNSNPSNEAEYLLANLCTRGILLTFYADNDLIMDVFPMATRTYHYVRRSFNFTSIYPDFYLFTGLYNYYREVYPKAHPSYKVLAFLFPRGNRAKGLKDIQTAAENSILLKAESYSYLSGIYYTYENNNQIALNYSRQLHELYPANPTYLFGYIKNLLLLKRYDEAEIAISTSDTCGYNTFFRAQYFILMGILKEKMCHDNKLSQHYYISGIRDLAAYGKYGYEYAAYGYFGLSRISGTNGDKEQKKIYRDQAMKLAVLKRITFDK